MRRLAVVALVVFVLAAAGCQTCPPQPPAPVRVEHHVTEVPVEAPRPCVTVAPPRYLLSAEAVRALPWPELLQLVQHDVGELARYVAESSAAIRTGNIGCTP